MAQLVWLMLTFALMFGAFQGPAEATLTFNLGNEGPIQINQKLAFFLFTSWVGEASAAPYLPTDKPTFYVPSNKYDHILKATWCACRDERKSLTNETEQQQYEKCETHFALYGTERLMKKGGLANQPEVIDAEIDAWFDVKMMTTDCSKSGGLTVGAISAITICGVLPVIAVIFCIYMAVSRKNKSVSRQADEARGVFSSSRIFINFDYGTTCPC